MDKLSTCLSNTISSFGSGLTLISIHFPSRNCFSQRIFIFLGDKFPSTLLFSYSGIGRIDDKGTYVKWMKLIDSRVWFVLQSIRFRIFALFRLHEHARTAEHCKRIAFLWLTLFILRFHLCLFVCLPAGCTNVLLIFPRIFYCQLKTWRGRNARHHEICTRLPKSALCIRQWLINYSNIPNEMFL